LFYSQNDGSVISKEQYKSGKRHGKWTYYFPGGELVSSEMKYRNGLLNGAFKSYDRSGNLTSIVRYKKNVKHGTTEFYDQNGTVIKEVKYKHGNRITNRPVVNSPV